MHKDTAMVIHLEYASVTDGTVMSSGWLWFDAFLADAYCLWYEATLWRITRCHLHTHVIMKANVSKQPIAN